ncbi:hypothetical protein ACH492_02295 [Streptomyces sp. NPDC019443]|uniref:hypothetical protein n=1 Tax=Streptomyces sp. NPDC019443 TaxID=3365061 RepID=UPI00378CE9BC
MAFDEPGQSLIQLIDLPRELLDALGQQPQGDASGLGDGILVALAVARAEARAGAEQLAVTQVGQPLPQSRVGYDQDGLELVDRLGTGLDRGVLGDFEHPGAQHQTVAGFGPGPGATAEHGPRSSLRVERVRLPDRRRAVRSGRFTSYTWTCCASR